MVNPVACHATESGVSTRRPRQVHHTRGWSIGCGPSLPSLRKGFDSPTPLQQFEKFLKIEFPFTIVSVTVRDNVEFPKFLKVRQ